MAKPKIKNDGRTITVRVPICIRRRGGRKVVLAPDGVQQDPRDLRCRQADNALVKAIARAFRWRDMLESGACMTIKEIARREAINESYIARILRLTLLSPKIVESILQANYSPTIALALLMRPFPTTWADQNRRIEQVTFSLGS